MEQQLAYTPIISNVIGTGELVLPNNNKIDLQFMASKMEGSRLNRKKFPGLVIRKTKPKGTVLLFQSCKFLIIGSNSPQLCQTLSLKLCKDMHKILSCQSTISLKYFKITNIIANAHLGYGVNIEKIAQLPYAYKDDKYSGVHLKFSNNQVKSVVVFSSGKIMMNGARKINDIYAVYEELRVSLLPMKLKYQRIIQKVKKVKKIKKVKKVQNKQEDIKQIQQQDQNMSKEVSSQQYQRVQNRKRTRNSKKVKIETKQASVCDEQQSQVKKKKTKSNKQKAKKVNNQNNEIQAKNQIEQNVKIIPQTKTAVNNNIPKSGCDKQESEQLQIQQNKIELKCKSDYQKQEVFYQNETSSHQQVDVKANTNEQKSQFDAIYSQQQSHPSQEFVQVKPSADNQAKDNFQTGKSNHNDTNIQGPRQITYNDQTQQQSQFNSGNQYNQDSIFM